MGFVRNFRSSGLCFWAGSGGLGVSAGRGGRAPELAPDVTRASGSRSGCAGGLTVASNAHLSIASSGCEDQVSWEVAPVAHFLREPSSG
jgi:hypothetical protein